MTARLLRSVAESAATPAFGFSSAALVRTAGTTTTAHVHPHMATPDAPPASVPADTGTLATDAAATSHHAHTTEPPVDHASAAPTHPPTPPADDHPRPVFTSWAQVRSDVAQCLTLLRHTLGLTRSNQHVLHLPCRHTGAVYRVPVTLIIDGETTQIVATTTSAVAAHSNQPHRAWIADARAARFVVLSRGSQQRIVELQPASSDDDHGPDPDHDRDQRLILLPDRATAPAHTRDASPFVPAAPATQPVATRRCRAVSPVV